MPGDWCKPRAMLVDRKTEKWPSQISNRHDGKRGTESKFEGAESSKTQPERKRYMQKESTDVRNSVRQGGVDRGGGGPASIWSWVRGDQQISSCGTRRESNRFHCIIFRPEERRKTPDRTHLDPHHHSRLKGRYFGFSLMRKKI